jgi:tungstate transport system ATP-binding protein
MSTLFRLQGVGVSLGGVQALSDCSLRIEPGERVALVGANGSGKSTLLRCLHGLVPPSRGDLQRAPVPQAMVFQRPFMLRASCQTNVALALWLAGRPWRQARAQALQALARVGLLALAARSARSLSGGQQQRLALARAWALQPQVLLLDEPTASLDPAAKKEVEALLAEFAASGVTLVFASHNLGQVKRLASRVLYLEGGRVRVDASTDRFFDKAWPSAATPFLQGELS